MMCMYILKGLIFSSSCFLTVLVDVLLFLFHGLVVIVTPLLLLLFPVFSYLGRLLVTSSSRSSISRHLAEVGFIISFIISHIVLDHHVVVVVFFIVFVVIFVVMIILSHYSIIIIIIIIDTVI